MGQAISGKIFDGFGAVMQAPAHRDHPAQTTRAGDERYRVLVVDDMATNRLLVRAALPEENYLVSEAANGEQALDMLGSRPFDVVLLDVKMPGIDGFETCRRIRANPDLSLLPVIMLTAQEDPEHVVHGMDVGASDYVTKPFEPVELIARVKGAAGHKRALDNLDDAESVLFALARMVEAKDAHTGNHCDRLAHASVVFGQALGLAGQDLGALRRGGVLHDIGKLGIPDSILLKKGPLSAEEWVVMRQHTTIGAALCAPLKTMRKTLDIVLCHHEKWDGSGYPAGLKGPEIPLLARIFQIVDIHDALASARPYKAAWSTGRIVATLQDEADQGFRDPELVALFLDLLTARPEALHLPPDSGRKLDRPIDETVQRSGALAWDRREQPIDSQVSLFDGEP